MEGKLGNDKKLYMRMVFDNEEFKLPQCKEQYCTYEEFTNYLKEGLFFDFEKMIV